MRLPRYSEHPTSEMCMRFVSRRATSCNWLNDGSKAHPSHLMSLRHPLLQPEISRLAVQLSEAPMLFLTLEERRAIHHRVTTSHQIRSQQAAIAAQNLQLP